MHSPPDLHVSRGNVAIFALPDDWYQWGTLQICEEVTDTDLAACSMGTNNMLFVLIVPSQNKYKSSAA